MRFPDTQFVLLDDARAQGAAPARLFTDPIETVTADSPDEIEALLHRLDRWHADGAQVAGWMAYEAGHALDSGAPEPRSLPDGWPIAWFARFATCTRIDSVDVPARLPEAAGAFIGEPRATIGFDDYAAALDRVLGHIAAGDIYQANLTFPAQVRVEGHPLAAYARLRSKAGAGYGGVVWTGGHWLLSLSPELFFSLREARIIARPMKGTARRGANRAEDDAARQALSSDPKQRAENLMIVDLLRNDLSRIADPGSVAVPSLFRIETYPTIHQMVSDVTARVAPETPPSKLLRALFPCGSITGAPKLSAMHIIDAVETAPRGPYTGSIGFFAPDGEAAFNVAIRTLALREGDSFATLGLGSGIVADSEPLSEWQECLAKGEFVRVASGTDFDLIETMAFDPAEGLIRLELHLERLGASARQFGFAYDRHGVRNMLQHTTFRLHDPARVRLRLSPRGSVSVCADAMPETPQSPAKVAIAPLPVATSDIRLRHKTSNRGFYDESRASSGAFEVLFTDTEGRLTEGSFTCLFVERDGMLLTPPLERGLLPGVLRRALIEEGRAVEADLTPADLSGGFLIGNSLRGLIPAELA
jgi:para-aminobenzoate synthetase / 4-amino-4-deoxychorismate lyase